MRAWELGVVLVVVLCGCERQVENSTKETSLENDVAVVKELLARKHDAAPFEIEIVGQTTAAYRHLDTPMRATKYCLRDCLDGVRILLLDSAGNEHVEREVENREAEYVFANGLKLSPSLRAAYAAVGRQQFLPPKRH